jgi:multidrug efflux system membrane fusion protein
MNITNNVSTLRAEERNTPHIGQRQAISLKSRGRWWVWLLLFCLVAAGAYGLLVKSGDAQQQAAKLAANPQARAVPIMAEPAKTSNLDVYLKGLGSVTPVTVTVKTRVDGQLMKVFFREGQVVKAGEVLAEIDPRPYQVQLNQAEGQMAHDQALLKNAQLDLARYRKLFAEDSIAKQQLDTQAALVRQYEGSIKVDQGQIDNAKLQLIYSRVTAPIGGRVGLRQVDPGNIVHASDSNGLVIVTQLQPITVVFSIPEDSLPAVMKKLQAGDKLPVDAYDRAGTTKLATGTLLTVDNQIDPSTGTVKLKAQFPNEDNSLFPNQFVNARMLLDIIRDATVIPSAAIQRGTQGTFVYVVKTDNTVTVRPIKLGPTQGEHVAVDTGITPGEMVVVDGADKLREGAKAELIEHNTTAREGGVPSKVEASMKGGSGDRQRRTAAAPASVP